MCNQTVSLISAELERQGIVTVTIQFLRFVAERLKAPRTLLVPFAHGYPLDKPNDPQRQHAVIEAALALMEDLNLEPGTIRDYAPAP